jgi:hypothetical protein
MRFLARMTHPTRDVIEAAIEHSGLEVVEAALVVAVQPLLPSTLPAEAIPPVSEPPQPAAQ